jgi:hypothetical protein
MKTAMAVGQKKVTVIVDAFREIAVSKSNLRGVGNAMSSRVIRDIFLTTTNPKANSSGA